MTRSIIEENQPRWYAAELVLDSVLAKGANSACLRDHQIRLIHATSPEAAYEKALSLGRSAEHEYLNTAGESVHWRFVGVGGLAEIASSSIDNGAEVYSWYTEGVPTEPLPTKEQLRAFAIGGPQG